MRLFKFLRFLLLGLTILFFGCGGSTSDSNPPPPSSARVVSIISTPPQATTATPTDYLNALQLAYAAGVRGQYIARTWKDLEPSPGTYDFSSLVDTLNTLKSVGGFRVLLGIQLINTTNRELPTDLQSTPFDAPEMQSRFQKMVAALLQAVGSQIAYLSIGDEVDVYLNLHPQEWSAYKTFVDGAIAYAKQQAPALKVGVTFTFNGAATSTAEVQSVDANADALILTYYPLNTDFTVRDVSVVQSDFATMLSVGNGKEVILQEAGYPSATSLGSSEQAQAQFVTNVFSAWSQHQSQIPFLNFFLLHDLTQSQCDTLASYYGLTGNTNFTTYVCSLGFRTVDGTPKAAWAAFTTGAAAIPH